MAPYKDSSLLQILRLSKNDPVSKVLNDAGLQNTDGKTGMTTIPFKDTIMQGFVSDLRTTNNGYKAHPQLFEEADVKVKKYIVVAAYNSNAGFIETYIRTLVLSGGVNAGISFAEGTGYFLKQPKGSTNKSFGLKNAGPGAVDITTKAMGKVAGYIREHGPTTGFDIPPTTKSEWKVSLEANVTVTDLKRNTIYGFREAIILPVPRKPKPSIPIAKEKLATPVKIGSAHKIIFSDTAPTNYVWGPWQYISTN